MTQRTGATQGSRRRDLAMVLVGALALSLLPLVGLAQPEPVDSPNDACPDEVNPPAPFTDRLQIPQVHRTNVDCAFNNDIALGFADQTYRPGDIVQRDQFASFMVRTMQAADVDLPTPTDQGFTDIAGNVHANNINIIAETGITVGTTPTTYSPSQRLRRDQIASFILRAAAFIEDVPLTNLQRGTGPFTDVPASNVHAANINGARALNLTIGRSAGMYAPDSGTRRDQMASFLVRLLAALSEGPLIPAEDRAETLALTPQTATNPVASSHTVTATVRDDEEALLADANVRFEVYRDADGSGDFTGPIAQGTQRTDAQGQSGFSYSGPAVPGSDRVVACAVRPNETCDVVDEDDTTEGTQFSGEPQVDARVDDTAVKIWRALTPDEEVDVIEIDEGDLDAVNPLGETHTVTVTAVDDDGVGVEGANVRFEVYRAPTADGEFAGPVEESSTTTDADGRASFSYSHDEEAVDRIVVCVPEDGTCDVTAPFTGEPEIGATRSAVATKRWESDDETERVEFDEGDLDAVNPLGETHTVTVTAFDDQDAGVEGAEVRFEVYRAPTADGEFAGPVEELSTTTDADGRASFSYSHDAEAVDRIVVCVPEDATCDVTAPFTGEPEIGVTRSAVATKRWEADPVIVEVEFDEDDLDAVNPLGQLHEVTVTASDDADEPVEGADVRFEVYRAPTADGEFTGPVEELSTTTDADGRASFSYSHDAVAVDRIVVCAPAENGTCDVTTPFTGEPTVGAAPNAVATKQWVVGEAADSLTARAFGLDVDVLGIGLIERLPEVQLAMPPDDPDEVTDEVLGLPLVPLVEASVIEVAARGDRDAGFAQGEAVVTDLEVLDSPLGGDALVTADLVRAVSTSTCPTPGTFGQASAGSQFVDVTVAGVQIPVNPAPNTAITIPGVAEVVVNEVIPDPAGEGHGFTVRGLRVTLLEGDGGEIIVAEAHSSVVCAATP